ncbi:MAG TPA: NAD(P)H-binding protein [Solirubrobacteraceae bacterium]|nr:NAD(P)H-binding protein [Solirubrobacteraceae bacterium]
MSLIVTGASGALGRRAAELLLDRVDPASVVLVTRSPDKLSDLAARGAQVRAGDFDDGASLETAFAGGERLLLISTDRIGARIPQHRAAVEAAKAAGVGFIAYTSVLNPVPENPAGVVPDHAATEAMLRESGLRWAFLRNGVYGEWAAAGAASAAEAGELRTNEGDGRVAYVSREDCAAAAAAVLAGPGYEDEVLDVTGPEALSAGDRAALFAEVTGAPVAVVELSDEERIADLVDAGMSPTAAERTASYGRAIREGAFDGVSDVVERTTGRAPRTLRAILDAARAQVQPLTR